MTHPAYPVPGLDPLDVSSDVYGLSGIRERARMSSEFGTFARPRVSHRRPKTKTMTAATAEPAEAGAVAPPPPSASVSPASKTSTGETVQQLVSRKVREKFRFMDSGAEPGFAEFQGTTIGLGILTGLGAGVKLTPEQQADQLARARQAKIDAANAKRQLAATKAAAKQAMLEQRNAEKAAAQAATAANKLALAQAKLNTKLAIEAAAQATQNAKKAAADEKAAIAGVTVSQAQAAGSQYISTPFVAPPAVSADPNAALYGQQYVNGVNPLLTQQQYAYPAPAAYYPPAPQYATAAPATIPYAEQEYMLPGAPEVPESYLPESELMSEGEPAAGFDEQEVGIYEGMGDFEKVEVGKDGFMDNPKLSMAAAGVPEGTTVIDEDRGEQQSAAPLDKAVRPPMVFDDARVGLPYKTGESMARLRKFGSIGVEIQDPAVVPLNEEDMVGRYGIDRVDFLDPMKFVGMGQLPTANQSAVASAQVALASLATREAQLQQYSQPAFDSFMANYAALRNSINSGFATLQSSTDLNLSASLALTAQIAMYKQALDAAVAAARPKPVKVSAPVKAVVKELPKAVKETVFSKYGMWVLGGGAVLVGGLLVLNMVMKRRAKA